VSLGEHRGWIRVTNIPQKRALLVEISYSLSPVLPALLARIRNLFDLSARPDVISEHLSRDPRLSGSVARNPGLRVPGAFDSFELAVRAVLGQQVTVTGASTLAGRFANAFGEPIETPFPDLTRLSPTPSRVAAAGEEELAALGVVRARARAIIALAGEVASGRLVLEPGTDVDRAIERLVALQGIGPWTAKYIAMRALRSPDAFPREDLVLRNRLGGVTPAAAEALSLPWRPWRSYATLHLWREGAGGGWSARDVSRPRPGSPPAPR
jgi:AraC family transcriptional regulator of adaptative response / DNA-3-methyladenine glycosylase II